MTFGSFVILSRKTELTAARTEIGKTVFSLPESFRIDKFIHSVILFTLVIETLGVLLLYLVFQRANAPSPLWSAIFHSISSFCTAGFSLYHNSFESFTSDFWLNLIVSILSYLGAIGFIVCVDCWRVVIGKIQRITLTSKIILWSTLWLTILGTLLLFVAEPSIRTKPADERFLAAFFQAMTSMTTVGFNTIGISQLSKASLLILIVLMIIGASPSGTGGGLKSTTFSAVFGVMRSAIKGEKEVRFWGRKVPLERIWMAVAGLGLYLLMLLIGTYLLDLTGKTTFEQNLFEAASALGTVGLSTGITAALSNIGKLILIFLMFCGRLGPLTFGIALFSHSHPGDDDPDSDLAV
jgi:trk system potassium uptake protein TrkH